MVVPLPGARGATRRTAPPRLPIRRCCSSPPTPRSARPPARRPTGRAPSSGSNGHPGLRRRAAPDPRTSTPPTTTSTSSAARDVIARAPHHDARARRTPDDELAERRPARRPDHPRPARRPAAGDSGQRVQDASRRCATTSARKAIPGAGPRAAAARDRHRPCCRSIEFAPASRSASRTYLWLLAGPGAAASGVWCWRCRQAPGRSHRLRAGRTVPVRERFALVGDLPFWLCLLAALAPARRRPRPAARAGDALRQAASTSSSCRTARPRCASRTCPAIAGSARCASCACSATR